MVSVLNAEEVPSGVSSGVGVNSEEKVVFFRIGFDNAVEVAAFEGSVEDEFVFEFEGWVHSFEGSVEDGRSVMVLMFLRLSLTNTKAKLQLTIFCRLTEYFSSPPYSSYCTPYRLCSAKVSCGRGPR